MQLGLSHDDRHVYTANYPPALPVQLTSITTAIKALDKPAIPIWARRVTAEAAVRNLDAIGTIKAEGGDQAAVDFLKGLADHKRDTKADVGTVVHSICEAIANDQQIEITPDAAPYVHAFRSFMADFHLEPVTSWIAVEYMVCNLTDGYAGTGDDVIWLPCPFHQQIDRWRIDKKTMGVNDRGQPKGPYTETALQLAAAEFATFRGQPNDPKKYAVPAADHNAVLALVEDGTYRLVPYDVNRGTYEAFLNALGAWRWLNGPGKSVMGQPVKPQVEAIAA